MNADTTTEPKAPADNGIAKFRAQLEQRLAAFAEALPPQISPQRFKSIVMWAVMADPGLLAADRVSLFEACLAAANDGLLPDKKESALVIYNTKVKEDGKEFWIKKVQFMPMIRGIFTKLYNTGQVKSAKVAIVYAGDRFRSWTDDAGDHIEYEEGEEQDRDVIRSAFAFVGMKDGGVYVETMKPADIEKIRAKSKSGNSGPWAEWWEEMAKKSVFRRLAKRLPMARDLDQVVSRDDYMYDAIEGDSHIETRRAPIPPRPPAAMLGAPVSRPMPMASPPERTLETADRDTGEVVDTDEQKQKPADKPEGDAAKTSGAGSSPSGPEPSSGESPAEPDDGDQVAAARRDGASARHNKMNRKAIPVAYQKEDLRGAWLLGFDTGEVERQPGEEG